MKLAGDHVEATLKVRNDVALGRGLPGDHQGHHHPGVPLPGPAARGSGSLPDNTFDLSQTEVPYDLQEALADVTTTYEQVDSDQFAQTLGILGEQMQGLPEVVPQALENTHTLSTIIADRRDQLGSLLKTTELVSTTLRRQQSRDRQLVTQGNDLVGEFVARRASIQAMLASLTNLVETLTGIVVDDRPELENLAHRSPRPDRHAGPARRSVAQHPAVRAGRPRGLTNATGNGNTVEMFVGNGLLIDSWMCAISGRAKQFNMIQYYKDCK